MHFCYAAGLGMLLCSYINAGVLRILEKRDDGGKCVRRRSAVPCFELCGYMDVLTALSFFFSIDRLTIHQHHLRTILIWKDYRIRLMSVLA